MLTRHVLAAVDDSAAIRPVLGAARWFASLLGVSVVAMHASERESGTNARCVADAAGVVFESTPGEPVSTICRAASQADVRALVIGARGLPAHRLPAGHVALEVISRVDKPVLVVPPDARVPADGRLHALAPVDENPASAKAVRDLLAEIEPAEVELVLLRVFDLDHLPRFANHGDYERDIFVDEFVRRTLPPAAPRPKVKTRVGNPAPAVLDVERETGADVVVLGWGRELSGERASVVKRLLGESKTPLLLLPTRDSALASSRA